MMFRFSILIVFVLQLSVLCYGQKIRHQRVEIPFNKEVFLEIHALGISVDNITQDQMMVLEINDSELKLLKNSEINYKIVIDDLEAFYKSRNSGKDAEKILQQFRHSKQYNIPEGFTFGSMGGFCTLDEIYAHLDYMAENYPNLISPKAMTGGLLTIEGRPVYWVRISDNPQLNEAEPEVLYTALVHAREPGSMQQMLFFMYYLLENYETNDEIKALVDNLELYFIPCVNPDGYAYNQSTNPDGGGMWRKNRRKTGTDTWGVDINRNFSYKWGYDNYGSSPVQSSSIYRGSSAFSEQESKIIRNFCMEHQFVAALNYHTQGNYLLQPWGYISYLYPQDQQIMQDWERLMTWENYYRFGNSASLVYLVNGDLNDWLYGEITQKPKCFGFTPEVGNSEDDFWPEIERIIPQCFDCVHMNILCAQLAGCQVTLTDLSPVTFSEHQGYIKFHLKRNGLQNAPVTVTVESIDNNFLSIGQPKTFTFNNVLNSTNDSIEFYLSPGIRPGDTISYVLKAACGSFLSTDTISRLFGQTDLVFSDNCDSLDHLITDEWCVTTQNYFSPSSSLVSVSGSYYPNNVTSTLLISEIFNLTDARHAWFQFYARWELDGGQDFVRCIISNDNGQTWSNLSGLYTTTHFVTGQTSMPVYAGKQTSWVRETIDLSGFCGTNVMLGFSFQSDASIGKTGFGLDDIRIEKLCYQLSSQEISISSGWSGLSGYLIPNETDISQVFSNQLENLDIVIHNDMFFQPGNPLSTLTDWNSMEGYKVKFSQNTVLQLTGYPETFPYIQLNQGWNLVPVLSSTPILVNDLITEPTGKVTVIRDAVGQNAYWPDQMVNTLNMLLPGKSYFIKVNGPCKFYY